MRQSDPSDEMRKSENGAPNGQLQLKMRSQIASYDQEKF